MRRWGAVAAALGLVALLTAMTGFLLVGHGTWAGPTVLVLEQDRGVHASDALVLLGWLAGVSATWWLLRAARRP